MIVNPRTNLRHSAVIAVLAAAALLGGAACGSSSTTSSSSAAPTSAAPASVDVSSLIIDASDIPIPGFTKTQTQPVQQGPATGVSVQFSSSDNTRQLGDNVVLLPDTTSAKAAAQGAFAAAPSEVGGAAGTPAQVGETAMIFSGTVSGQAVVALVFQQGRAFATLQFVSPVNDPVPADVVTAVGQKQADKIKAGLT